MTTHRKFKSQLKFQVVLEAIKRERANTEIARQYGIHPQLIVNWKREFFQKAPSIFEEKRKKEKDSKKTENLEKIIGQQTIEIQLLKNFLGQISSD